jgi:chromosome segregation ATPase
VGQAETLLAVAADLQRRDEEVAATLDEVTALSRRAAEIRPRAGALRSLLDAAPAQLAELDRREAESRDASAEAVRVLDGAEQRLRELDGSRSGADERTSVERDVRTARELVADATARSGRLARERAELIAATTAAREEAAELVLEARRAAEALQAIPRVSQSGREPPVEDLAHLDEWASRVQAALFVVRGQLEGERDRLVREANELGTVVLGEQVAGSSVALVRRRLEEALDA